MYHPGVMAGLVGSNFLFLFQHQYFFGRVSFIELVGSSKPNDASAYNDDVELIVFQANRFWRKSNQTEFSGLKIFYLPCLFLF